MTTPTPAEAASIARNQAERIAALWQKPLLSDRECAEALGLPYSTWAGLKKSSRAGAPSMFRLGRRLYAHTEEVRAWLAMQSKAGANG
jgi:predicted DNA-binding transcriptional regulator AlpA